MSDFLRRLAMISYISDSMETDDEAVSDANEADLLYGVYSELLNLFVLHTLAVICIFCSSVN